MAFSPDSKQLLSGSADGSLRAWDTATGKEQGSFAGHKRFVYLVACSRDGDLAVSVGASEQPNEIKIWDLKARKEKLAFLLPDSFITSVSISPDNTKVVTTSHDKTARVWDTADGTERAVLKGHTDPVNIAEFSPDGSILATGGWDGRIILWDTATWKQRSDFREHKVVVERLAFSADGKMVASCGGDGGPGMTSRPRAELLLWETGKRPHDESYELSRLTNIRLITCVFAPRTNTSFQ